MRVMIRDGDLPGKKVDVTMRHQRGVTHPDGLDIKYTMNLDKIVAKPTATGLKLLQRLTGIDLEDIIDTCPSVGGPAASVSLFSQHCLRDAPGDRVSVASVYQAYCHFCTDRDEKPINATVFGAQLRRIHPDIHRGRMLGTRENCHINLQLI